MIMGLVQALPVLRQPMASLQFGVAALAFFLFLSCLLAQVSSGAQVDTSKLPAAATRKVDFLKDIEPIFADHCYSCHGSKKQESALRLDQKSAAMKGGDTFGAAAIVPGKSADSVLIQAVAQAHSELK